MAKKMILIVFVREGERKEILLKKILRSPLLTTLFRNPRIVRVKETEALYLTLKLTIEGD
jgi:hypothetical protein